MSKISNISGFPEFLPEEKLLEEQITEKIRAIYKSFGFVPIETPAVELKSTLSSKGIIDKEIYVLKRALHDDEDKKSEEELALHFDLTVPFARYVAQHFNNLIFPFKRYQLQKVWRGERPQKGRFREFYQFDIDIVNRETLPISCDAEIVAAIHKVFSELNLGKFEIRINNRKILLGLYQSLGLDTLTQKKVITIVDKLDKIGIDGIKKELEQTLSLNEQVLSKILNYTELKFPLNEIQNKLSNLIEGENDSFKSGVQETVAISKLLPKDSISFDLSLARGLDYYTGTIFEVSLTDFPEFGTVSSGGRYDDLASQFINQKIPGVGGSIGLTRLMDLIIKNKILPIQTKSPSQLLLTVFDENTRPGIVDFANQLRINGLNCEVYPSAPKLGKQIEYADKKGIRFCVFLEFNSSLELSAIKIKDLSNKEESQIDLSQDDSQYRSLINWIKIR